SFTGLQRPARYAFGAEGKITLQPEGSDWKLSAGIRYGRSNAARHKHRQISAAPVPYDVTFTLFGYPHRYEGSKYLSSAALADVNTTISQSHVVLDFQAGKDVGLGLFGRNASSTINAGVRFASFVTHSHGFITARPEINDQTIIVTAFLGLLHIPIIRPTFHQYTMTIDAGRSFRGLGPTLSWDASAALIGDKETGELTLDWGVNGALLFGRQKAKIEHTTNAYHQVAEKYVTNPYPQTAHVHNQATRSRSAVIPNIGGFAGFSVKYPNLGVSIGYRADFFFGAMDVGSDVRATRDVGFHGPFATVSIGLGG